MSDNVLPFSRRRPADPPPVSHQGLHSATRRARPEARDLAAEQNAAGRQAFAAAAGRQREQRLLAGGRVVPARITIALDIRGLDGPDVDLRCGTFEGNPDGDVDRWELALAAPTAEQVQLLAELTDFPIGWFYKPLRPGPTPGDGPIWMCWADRRCEAVAPDIIDERGVLLYGGQPRTLPPAVQGQLFHVDAEPVAEPAADPRSKSQKRKSPPVAAGQMRLPNRMPEHLRAELAATLNDRKNHPRPGDTTRN